MVLCRACYDHEMAYRLQRGDRELPPWVSLKVYDPATALPRPHKRKATGARPRTDYHKFGEAVARLLRAREDWGGDELQEISDLAEAHNVSLVKPIEDL
jgi:hypothetical protein